MRAPVERVCFIHIGTHKTGTTSIQAFLAENRVRLRAAGLFIPLSAGKGEPEFACHHGIVRQLHGSSPVDVYGGLDAVIEELHATDAPLSCISSEDLSLLHDRPDLLMRLREAVIGAGFTPKIVVYLRPQASFSVAVYATNVSGGFRTPFNAYLHDIFKHGSHIWDAGYGPPLDYTRMLDGFCTVFGTHAIVAKPFRSDAPDRSLLESFIGCVLPGVRKLDGYGIPPKRANRTLTFSAVLTLLGAANDIDEHVRFAPLTLTQLGRLWLRFAPANRALALRYNVRIPVFELADVVRALPFRRRVTLARQLRTARRLLAQVGSNPVAVPTTKHER